MPPLAAFGANDFILPLMRLALMLLESESKSGSLALTYFSSAANGGVGPPSPGMSGRWTTTTTGPIHRSLEDTGGLRRDAQRFCCWGGPGDVALPARCANGRERTFAYVVSPFRGRFSRGPCGARIRLARMAASGRTAYTGIIRTGKVPFQWSNEQSRFGAVHGSTHPDYHD